MKTLISLIVMILILSSVSFAQKVTPDKVPAVVKQAFSKEYPKAIETSWRMYDNNYQALFNLNGVKHAAKFDKNGQWIDKEERIDLSNLPKEVTASIAKNFAGYKAYEAEKVETPNKGLLYNVGLEKEKAFLEVHFSIKGEVLDKVAKDTKIQWGEDND
jgi:uncharacterized protein YxeA